VGLPTYALGGDESRIYDLIVRHFLASISKDAKYLVTKAVFASSPQHGMDGGEVFSCRGKEEIDPGFMRVYGRDSHDSEV
jgi:DNA topoisomerase IA